MGVTKKPEVNGSNLKSEVKGEHSAVSTEELTDSDKWLNDQMDDIDSKAVTSFNVKETKNGGFFAALDKMEKGELETKTKEEVCPIEASLGLSIESDVIGSSTSSANIKDQSKDATPVKQSNGATTCSATPTQSKLTDFFQVKTDI